MKALKQGDGDSGWRRRKDKWMKGKTKEREKYMSQRFQLYARKEMRKEKERGGNGNWSRRVKESWILACDRSYVLTLKLPLKYRLGQVRGKIQRLLLLGVLRNVEGDCLFSLALLMCSDKRFFSLGKEISGFSNKSFLLWLRGAPRLLKRAWTVADDDSVWLTLGGFVLLWLKTDVASNDTRFLLWWKKLQRFLQWV